MLTTLAPEKLRSQSFQAWIVRETLYCTKQMSFEAVVNGFVSVFNCGKDGRFGKVEMIGESQMSTC